MAVTTRPHVPFSRRATLPAPIWVLFRIVRVTLIASAFAWFWIFAVLLAWLVLPAITLFSRDELVAVRRCQSVLRYLFRVLFHGYMRILRLFDARPIDVESLVRGPSVIIANHTTLVDVTAIFSYVPNLCCIAKSGYSKNPFIGRLLRLGGFISIGAELDSKADGLAAAVERLNQGFSVLVFPEGTRSPLGGMHKFQRGAFEMACRAGVPVQPLVLRCEPSALRRGQRFWAQPDECARLHFETKPAIHPSDFSNDSRKMRDFSESSYRGWLELEHDGVS